MMDRPKEATGLRARGMANTEWLDTTDEGRIVDEQQRVTVQATYALGRAMDEAGFSNADLARALGVDRSVVTKMLRGTQGLSIERLAHAFQVMGFSFQVGYGPAVKPGRGKAK